jgi:hypothetical protein
MITSLPSRARARRGFVKLRACAAHFIGGESLPAVRPKLHPRDATPCADSHSAEPHQSELDPTVAGWRNWAMRGLRTGSFGWRWGKRWFHRRRLDHRNRTRPEPIPGHQATGLVCRRDEG